MKHLILITCLASSIFSVAQEPTFQVTTSNDTILLGNYLIATFTLENANVEDFQPPAFEGFRLVSGPNQSSSFSMINGKVSQKISYSYYLEPKDIGQYFIPPASIITDKGVLETAPIEILAVPNPDGIVQPPASNQESFNSYFFKEQDDFFNMPLQPTPKKRKKKRKTYKL